MKVQVKLYASLSRYSNGLFSGTPFEVELPDGETLQHLVDLLKLPPEETKVLFVNGLIEPLETRLAEGDVVGIFPPIAGG